MNTPPTTPPFPQLISALFEEALVRVGIERPEDVDLVFVPTGNPEHGDYQTNLAMRLAKLLKKNPREIAGEIATAVGETDLFELPTVAGPGFLNVRLRSEAFATRAVALLADSRLGVPESSEPTKIIIDYSSPNVAKQMHIGHIRSTVIGDCLVRIARFLGHDVTADNHIGDWGTPMGRVIYGWKNDLDKTALEADGAAELQRIYQSVSKLCKTDPAVAEASRQETAKLQSGDSENTEIWNELIRITTESNSAIYDRLGVSFDTTLGESYYDDRLPALVEELKEKGIATESDGAMCVFSDGSVPQKEDPFLVHRDGEWEAFPCLVQKEDGAFNYATTDLATIDYRVKDAGAEKVWYVVDDGQSAHFAQVFSVSKRRGYCEDLVHVKFGKILSADGTKMSSRDGGTLLTEVLQEAHDRARKIVDEKSRGLSEDEKVAVAENLGIGAVKYAELSQARHKDYAFDWDKMLALKGNTAPYLLNAYVRTRSIFRKLGEDAPVLGDVDVVLTEPGEIALMRQLAQFGEVVPAVLGDHRPNLLANYLYSLAGEFHRFYEACPIMQADSESQRDSRLVLAELTSRTLKCGLGLLGMGVTDRM